MMEPISLCDDWSITEEINNGEVTRALANCTEPLEPDSRQLLRVNYSVGEEASLNDIITVNSESIILLDAWGNNGATSSHNDWTITITDVLSISNKSNFFPNSFSIDRIFPNPFNPLTRISFSIPIYQKGVKVRVFDILGSLEAELVNGPRDSGKYTIDWNASNRSSGIYFVELKTEQFRKIKKITLIK